MKKILVVDDEKLARDRVVRMLGGYFSKHPHEHQIEIAKNGFEAIQKFKEFGADIAFLDVQMPELSGFDVLNHLENKDFQLVFQTAYEEYAIQAFEQAAVDYLLKPFSEDRFEKTMNRLMRDGFTEEKKKSQAIFQQKNIEFTKIVSKKNGVVTVLSTRDISQFYSLDHYTFCKSNGKEFLIDVSIEQLSMKLNQSNFFRIHRNCIVNLNEIEKVGPSPENIVKLRDGESPVVARSRRKELLQKLSLGCTLDMPNDAT